MSDAILYIEYDTCLKVVGKVRVQMDVDVKATLLNLMYDLFRRNVYSENKPGSIVWNYEERRTEAVYIEPLNPKPYVAEYTSGRGHEVFAYLDVVLLALMDNGLEALLGVDLARTIPQRVFLEMVKDVSEGTYSVEGYTIATSKVRLESQLGELLDGYYNSVYKAVFGCDRSSIWSNATLQEFKLVNDYLSVITAAKSAIGRSKDLNEDSVQLSKARQAYLQNRVVQFYKSLTPAGSV